MDFFERQDQARRSTKWLVVYFILAIVCIIAGVYLVCAFLFSGGSLWNPPLLGGVAAITLLVIFIGSFTKTLALRQGGSAVARALGGRPLSPQPSSLEEQRLRNVVEEMAVASGTPVPEIYILGEEMGINAFAAGHTPGDAAIGVTAGAIQSLNREELQGVIAHEFSHILNGDMRLNLRLMGVVHGILCLTLIGRVLLRTGMRRRYLLAARRDQGGNPLPLLGLALILIGFIGVFFGRLIKSAVSRQREYLADSSAVQFTRNPLGLAGALKKIGGLTYGSRLAAPKAEEASHMFFGNGLRPAWFQLLATHPPLVDRIRALEPEFDGKFPAVEPPRHEAPPVQSHPIAPAGFSGLAAPPRPEDLKAGAAAGFSSGPVKADRTIPTVGRPTPEHLVYARTWRGALPEAIDRAAHDVAAAPALVYALLLSEAPEQRLQQLQELSGHLDPATHQNLIQLASRLEEADRQSRLPLIDLSLAALRHLTPAQYQKFIETTRWITEQDRQIDLFEFTLQKILIRHLEPYFRRVLPPTVQYYSLKPLLPDCRVLLSALAYAGHSDPTLVEQSFDIGYSQLNSNAAARLLPLPQCGLAAVDAALNRLALASPQIKKRLLNAAAQAIAADGMIRSEEAELIRAIADTLDCPIPPFLDF